MELLNPGCWRHGHSDLHEFRVACRNRSQHRCNGQCECERCQWIGHHCDLDLVIDHWRSDEYQQHDYGYHNGRRRRQSNGNKLGTPSPVLAGNNITYTQSVINRGPSNAATVSFTEAVPANTTFVSATTPGTWACSLPPVGGTGNLSCSITTLAPNTTTNFQFVVKV